MSTFAASALATDHTVTVGGDNLNTYSPSEIKAEKGETVTFECKLIASHTSPSYISLILWPSVLRSHLGTHDIIQGPYDDPCRPLSSNRFYSKIVTVNHTIQVPGFTYLYFEGGGVWRDKWVVWWWKGDWCCLRRGLEEEWGALSLDLRWTSPYRPVFLLGTLIHYTGMISCIWAKSHLPGLDQVWSDLLRLRQV